MVERGAEGAVTTRIKQTFERGAVGDL